MDKIRVIARWHATEDTEVKYHIEDNRETFMATLQSIPSESIKIQVWLLCQKGQLPYRSEA